MKGWRPTGSERNEEATQVRNPVGLTLRSQEMRRT